MTSQTGSNPVLGRLLLAGLLLGVFCLGAGGVIYFALRGRAVSVPNVIGMTEEKAAEELDDAGLRMAVRSRIYDKKIPVNSVCDQYPVAGTTVKTGQLVRVSLSLGAELQNQSAAR